MLDFATLPPEIISTMMYSGPGAAPLIAAASAWDLLAGQLNSSALGYSSVVAELQDDVWSGAASHAMVAAATPYIAWVSATATLAEQSANQIRAAAAAYETAYAATVPPAAVTANRSQWALLIATNLLGQNTTAIAALEAAYAQMWAVDATAMHGYAASASTATELTPFQEPPQTTSSLAQTGPHVAPAQAAAAVPPTVQPIDPPSLADTVVNGVGGFNTLTGPESFGAQISRTVTNAGSFFTALAKAMGGSAPKVPIVPTVPTAATAGAAGVTLARQVTPLASVGEAAPLGRLSVPRAWADATPVAAAAEEPLWLSEAELAAASSLEELPEAGMLGAAPVAGMGPMAGVVARGSVSSILRVGPRRFTMPRPAIGG